MQVRTVNGVLKHCATTGTLTWCGYTTAESIAGLTVSPVSVLDPEDGSGNVYVLAMTGPLSLLDETAATALVAGEARRQVVAKLSDAELALLSITRE